MTLLLLHAVSTFLLTGLIWVIQLVHYPIFRFLDQKKFRESMIFHQRQISFIAMPLMLIELFSGIYLAFQQWESLTSFHLLNIGLLAIIWVHTFFLMVPLHQSLTLNYNTDVLQKMLRYHWLRTTAWTIRSILWIAILWHILSIY